MNKPKPKEQRPQALIPGALDDSSVHSMYAQNIHGMTDAKLVVDLLALIKHDGRYQKIAAQQITEELYKRLVLNR